MDKVVWNERLNIGVEVVDKAHAKLFQVVGNLIELVENEENYQKACKRGLAFLEDYTMKHFFGRRGLYALCELPGLRQT